MENADNQCKSHPVNTGIGKFWEAEQVGRIINLLPEGGSLTIKRVRTSWDIVCRIERKLILKAEDQEPERHLQYIEDLLKTLKGFEANA